MQISRRKEVISRNQIAVEGKGESAFFVASLTILKRQNAVQHSTEARGA